MQVLFSAVMGLVQGLSEFLPISSSGHLLFAEKLLGLIGYNAANIKSLTVMLHVGTLIAVAAIFFKDWLDMLLHPIKNKTLLLLFIASLPALFAVLLFGDIIDSTFTGWFLGPAFLITALLLCLAEYATSKGKHTISDVKMPNALIMGGFQAVALLPGVSRSGSTLFGGVLSGLNRPVAAKFSFMMSAPAILASFIVELKDVADAGELSTLFGVDILVGVLVAAVSGFLAIKYMLKLINKISFYKFAVYVAVIGIITIVFQLTGFAGFPAFK
ncbi:MAG: undecaprenyl-diphosphate phosphatase [Eubacteriales bacterium]|nr:undecaprenyl-diphosphate phosphatase [Eubacteriales bacterium]